MCHTTVQQVKWVKKWIVSKANIFCSDRQEGAHLGKFAKPFIYIHQQPCIVYLQYLRHHVLMPLHFFLQTLLRFIISMQTFLKSEHVKFEAYNKSVCLPKPLYSILAHHNLSTTTVLWSTWASSIRLLLLLLRLIWYDKSGSLFPLNGTSYKSYVWEVWIL